MLCLVKHGEERRGGRDRRKKKEKEIESEEEGWSGGGRGQVGSERDERSGIEGRRKWNGEKARYGARYFPHGERSLFTSPLSESAPTGASEKKFRFSCAVKVTPSHALALLLVAALEETYPQSVTSQRLKTI